MSTNTEYRLQQQVYELMIRLAASEEARKKAETDRDGAVEQYLESQKAWRAAEARIKASQEQEPVGYLYDEEFHEVRPPASWPEIPHIKLYKQPIIPPEAAELQREIEQMELNAKQLISAYEKVIGENAELTRKLAEQQAVIKYAIEISESALDGKYDDHKADAHLHIVNRLKNSHNFELTKLLEEAKRQPVPEGWKLVPIEPEK